MKFQLFILFMAISSSVFCQVSKSNQNNFEYQTTSSLLLNFDSIGISPPSIEWKKFETLESVEIYGYSTMSSILKGIHNGNFKNLAINYSDINAFFSENKIPKSVSKITIYLSESYGDTLSIPKKLSELKNLSYLSIGCCSNLTFETCDLSKLSNLDTLIITSPVSNLNFLNGLEQLSYIGFWSPMFESSKSELDSLLPNTEKEAACFPGDQIINLWNGSKTSLKNISIGDTILSYDFEKNLIIPSIVEEIEFHRKDNYLCGTVVENNLVASKNGSFIFTNKTGVTATINHPIPTSEGVETLGTLKSGSNYYAMNSSRILEVRIADKIVFEFRNEPVYNIKTSTNNYFIGDILFLEK